MIRCQIVVMSELKHGIVVTAIVLHMHIAQTTTLTRPIFCYQNESIRLDVLF